MSGPGPSRLLRLPPNEPFGARSALENTDPNQQVEGRGRPLVLCSGPPSVEEDPDLTDRSGVYITDWIDNRNVLETGCPRQLRWTGRSRRSPTPRGERSWRASLVARPRSASSP